MQKDEILKNFYKNEDGYFMEFKKPASSWSDSFLMGDGHLGVCVYGDLLKETIELSHNTFFSGEKEHLKRQSAPKAFLNMRNSLLEEDYEKAFLESKEFIGIRGNYGTNLPVGDLKIDFSIAKSEKCKNYKRTLNIFEGMGEVSAIVDDVNIKKEFFVNHADHSLYYSINYEKNIDCKIYFSNNSIKNKTYSLEEQYFFEIKALEKIHSDGKTGVKLKGGITVFDCDGDVFYHDDFIEIKNFKNCVIRLVTDTDFDVESETLISDIDEKIFIKAKYNYSNIKNEHKKDISSFMTRFNVSFDGNDDLSEFLLQYGRYLLLSSSREDSLLPTSLQGIWNDNVACQIGWSCDMHLDINTQMNYWISESANLKETHIPLINWLEKILVPSGRKTAKDYYGMSGWSADLVSNAWGYSSPYWSSTISPCPTCGTWQASDVVTHYKFSLDKAFLEKSAFPMIEESAEFFLDYIFENGNAYSVGPSISPENSYIVNGKRYYFMIDSTYEKLMIYELFNQYLYLCNQRNIKGKYEDKIRKVLANFNVYNIDDDGKLMEFDKNYKEYDAQHRHTSHLLGLYPYNHITPRKTPELSEACYNSIKARLVHYENFEDTGWARSMLILYMARLNKGEEAYWHIKEMQSNLLNPNFLVIHPPTREAPSFKEVYELDGNTGLSMGIIEMIIRSNDEYIEFLPSIPKMWSKGYLLGVRVYGNMEIDMYWENFKLTKLCIKSETEKVVKCIINGEDKEISVNIGTTVIEL